jgi:hypothetical protein
MYKQETFIKLLHSVISDKKSLKISKGLSESVYRKRTDNTMAKRKTEYKKTNNDMYIKHTGIKLKIE